MIEDALIIIFMIIFYMYTVHYRKNSDLTFEKAKESKKLLELAEDIAFKIDADKELQISLTVDLNAEIIYNYLVKNKANILNKSINEISEEIKKSNLALKKFHE